MGRKNRKGAFDPLNPLGNAQEFTNKYYHFYQNYLIELASSLFKWNNLPSSVNSWYIENQLLFYGGIVYLRDETIGDIVINATGGGKLNLYNEPVSFTTVNPNYSPKTKDSFWGQPLTQEQNKYCVAIYNSPLKKPYINDLNVFAQDLSEICAIQNINLNAQKTPMVHLVNGFNNYSVKGFSNQLDNNPLNIIVDKDSDLENVRSLDTGAPFLVDKMETQLHAKWNEIMTFLGINNANIDKKERTNQQETNGNNSQVLISRYNRLSIRQLACDRINQLFGLNVSVEFRDIDNIETVSKPDIETEEQS